MAVTSKPKSVVGDVSSAVTTAYNAPTAVPGDWGAGYAAAQLKRVHIANGSTATTSIAVTVAAKAWNPGIVIAPGKAWEWEGTHLLSTAVGITFDGSSGGSSLCDYHLSLVEFTS